MLGARDMINIYYLFRLLAISAYVKRDRTRHGLTPKIWADKIIHQNGRGGLTC